LLLADEEVSTSMQSIGVVGCGWMGAGIAEAAALAGFDVVAVKVTPGLLDAVARRIDKSLERAVARGKLAPEARDRAMARITITSDVDQLATAGLVVESAIESLVDKQRVLTSIERVLLPSAILASNTSSLPLLQLAATLERPQQFLGLHFFSPVQVMELVELAALPATDLDVVQRATAIVERLGKVPIQTGEGAGYIVNRLLVPFLCHAIETLESGVAGAKDIDRAIQLGCRHPMGPLALSDVIGLDVVLAMARSLQGELDDKRFRAPSLLRRLVSAGHLGRKTGLGLYDYRGPEPVENDLLRRDLCAPAA
jgi:3-hydroxybutyryl-CoA dehydrogenase